jgi:hypothetical protein
MPVSRTDQSCNSCKSLKFGPLSDIGSIKDSSGNEKISHDISVVPVCTKGIIDFVDELGLDDSKDMYDKVPQLRSGELVAIGNIFFRIIPDDKSIPRPSLVDSDPEEAEELSRRMGAHLETEDLSLTDDIRNELIKAGIPSFVIDEVGVLAKDYEELQSDILKYEAIIPADSTIRYIPAGTQYTCVIEPFLKSHGCSHGINRVSNISFSEFQSAERDNRLIERLSKELYADKVVIDAINGCYSKLLPCSYCGFPMPQERNAVGYDYCIWCSEEISIEQGSYDHNRQDWRHTCHSMYRKSAYIVLSNTPILGDLLLRNSPDKIAKSLNLKLAEFFVKANVHPTWHHSYTIGA